MSIRYLSGINVDSGTLVVDDVNNRVGIGTASPVSILDLASSTPILTFNAVATGEGQGIVFRQSGTVDASIKHTPSSGEFNFTVGRNSTWGGDFRFVTDTYDTYLMGRNFHRFNILGSEAMRISDTSNVGIGTTNPAYKLDVSGTARVNSNAQVLTINGTNHAYYAWSIANARKAYAGFASASTNDFTLMNEHTGSMFIGTNAQTKVTITSTGNVGIGTTSPNSFGFLETSLHISAGSASSTTLQQAALIIQGSSDADDAVDFGYLAFTNYQSTLANNRVAEIRALRGDTVDKGELTFFTANGATVEERLRITPTGNIGIGTTIPTSKLQVQGSFKVSNQGVFESYIDVASTIFHRENIRVLNKAGTNWVTWATRDTSGAESKIIFTNVGGNISQFTNDSGYLTAEADTLDTVTDRGNTTTNSIAVGNITVNTSSAAASYIYLLSSPTGESELRMGDTDTDAGSIAYNNANDFMAFRTNAAERVRITSAGNVGIGTTSPSQKLDVVGKFRVTDDIILAQTNGRIDYDNGATGALRFFSTSASAERMRITTAGNVGIGTTSPGYKLSIDDNTITSTPVTLLQFNSEGIANNGGYNIDFRTSTNDLADRFVARIRGIRESTGALSQLSFWTEDGSALQQRMTIRASGNVGIGTTSPEANLHVAGSTYIRNNNSTNQLTIDNNSAGSNATPQYSDVLFGGYSSSLTARIRGIDRASNLARGGIIFQASTDGTTLVDRLFLDGNGESYFYNNSAEVMRITSAGNVGIGTTAPTYKLDINSSSATGFRLTTDGFTGLDLESNRTSGNIGGVRFKKIGDAATTNEFLGLVGGGFTWLTGVGVSNPTEKMRITSAGNVGIGTASPSEKLTVAGELYFPNISTTDGTNVISFSESTDKSFSFKAYYNGTGASGNKFGIGSNVSGWSSNIMTWQGDGNVGVGTTSPLVPLHIQGQVNNGLFKALLLHNNSIGGDIGSSTETSLDFIHTDGNTTTTAYPRARISVKQGTVASDGFNSEAGGDLLFSTAFGTAQDTGILYERMRINDAGNVGIGTSAPTHVLDVRSLTTGNLLNLRSDGTGGDAAGFAITAEPNIIRLSTTTNLDALAFNTGSTQTERMRIDSAGNVGIGTTSPVTILDVNSSTADSVAFFRSSDNRARIGVEDNDTAVYVIAENSYASFGLSNVLSSTNLNINGSGNVGIGTTNPDVRLHVNSDGTLNTQTIVLGIASLSLRPMIQFSEASVATAGSGMSIEYDGRGSGVNNKMYINDVNSSPVFTVMSGGNVGIGNTDPSQKLHVSGNLRVTGAYYDSNNEAGTSGQVLTSTGTGTDWKSLSEITGVDGTGTANYVAKWSDTDTIANSQIQDNGTTVGIGVAPGPAKLTVTGSAQLGSRAIYVKSYASLDTTGVAVAGLIASTNGDSSLFEFTCNGGAGQYQRIVYACHNTSTIWNARKVIDEGTNELDVVASASATTITFTFKARTTAQGFTPRVTVEVTGSRDASYL